MTDTAQHLEAPPDADKIEELRAEAETQGESVEVSFTAPTGTEKRFVASPRGTCVVLDKTREASFIPSVSAQEVAAALRE